MGMNSIRAALAALAVCAAASCAAQNMELSIGIHRIEAEVANTDASRETGLMRRTSMPPIHGMLFVFTEELTHCMWMKNTLIPLSVAFIDAQGKIINIEEMQAQTETNHCARRPARYALEMNAHWFQQKGAKPGMVVNGLERAPAPR